MILNVSYAPSFLFNCMLTFLTSNLGAGLLPMPHVPDDAVSVLPITNGQWIRFAP